MTRTTITLLVAALCLGACDDASQPPQSQSDVLTMWRNAGLTVADHAPLAEHALGDADCQRGAVSGIETTVCSYASDDAAKAAQPAGLNVIGSVTGASLPRGKVLLVVADRNNVDPNGKTIHKVTKSFLGR